MSCGPRLASMLTVLTVVPACLTQTHDKEPTRTEDIRVASVHLLIEGAISVAHTAPNVRLHIDRIEHPLLDTRVLALEPASPIPVGADVRVLPGFLLSAFKGDGAYSIGGIDAVPGDIAVNPEPAGYSAGWLRYITDEQNELYRDGRCMVAIEHSGGQGKMECEDLTGSGGEVVSLTFTWRGES